MNRGIIIALLCVALVSCQSGENKQNENSMDSEKNPVVGAIMSRRSVRAFQPDQIKPEELNVMLECAINAPSAMNRQPWVVRVIQNQTLLDSMVVAFVEYAKQSDDPKMVERVSAQGYSPIYHAPTFIIVAHDTANPYGMSDCGMLVQNILLAAESIDIGTCTIGGFMRFLKSPQGAVYAERLNIPQGYELHLGVAVGYKAQHPEAKPRDASKIQFVK